VRCMLAKLMLTGPNALIMDEPTNHLDLESITALNDALIAFKGSILFTSHDHEFVNTVANRIIEFTPTGIIDRTIPFDEYLASPDVKEQRDAAYHGHHVVEI
jgi:ATPase subunit of ABC transporter with duplicated ATPase domains